MNLRNPKAMTTTLDALEIVTGSENPYKLTTWGVPQRSQEHVIIVLEWFVFCSLIVLLIIHLLFQ